MLRKNLNYKLLKYFFKFSVKNRTSYFINGYKRYYIREDTDFRYIILYSRGNYIYDSYVFSTLHICSNQDTLSDKDNEYIFNLFLLN